MECECGNDLCVHGFVEGGDEGGGRHTELLAQGRGGEGDVERLVLDAQGCGGSGYARAHGVAVVGGDDFGPRLDETVLIEWTLQPVGTQELLHERGDGFFFGALHNREPLILSIGID